MKADFSGYASKNGLLCSDGRVIQENAFKEKDRKKIPLVWQHRHNEVENVLGHAIVENRPDGVYVYGMFNDTEKGKTAKMAVQHGDVDSLSIYANRLEHKGNVVVHGNLVEVSLVLAGANPGAFIDNVTLEHGDRLETLDDAADFYLPAAEASLHHSADDDWDDDVDLEDDEDDDEEEDDVEHGEQTIAEVIEGMSTREQAVVHALVGEALAHADSNDDGEETVTDTIEHADGEETVADVFNTLSDKQKQVVYYMLGSVKDGGGDLAQSGTDEDNDEDSLTHSQEGNDMRNIFDGSGSTSGAQGRKTLSHSEIQGLIKDGIRKGSLRDAVLEHAEAGTYGITNIDLLFPDAKNVSDYPELIARQADWVPKVLDATKKQPFAKVKTVMADLTAEEARAKGYIKGTQKKDEVIELLRRTTGPATIYKKQRLDRDDILDITDFDAVEWLKWEIRFMLNEEVARAILVGDGRTTLSEDKIKDPKGAVDGIGLRSIANDHELFAVKIQFAANTSPDGLIDGVTRERKQYRGSGTPTFYTTDDTLTDLLLLKDKMNRRLYNTPDELASALRVKEIVTVPVMEETNGLLGIIVNLIDYTVGTNQGGQLTFFEDFDIDFNQNKYLLETRLSGGLTKPKSALVLWRETGVEATPAAPSFNGATNTITIPTTAGVVYTIDDEAVSGSVVITKATEVNAEPADGHYLAPGSTTSWTYTYTA